MSQPIPAAQRCAASSCNRIDLIPSRLAAGACLAWLALACVVTGFGVALPSPVRAAACAVVALAGLHAVRTFVLLRGRRAVRAIEWTGSGEFFVYLGMSPVPQPALLANGTFRLGARFWVLRFTTPSGPRAVLVEEAAGGVRAFRRLSRCLIGHNRRGSGRCTRPAVTIRPKV
jgi:hypothetical protein